VVDEVALEQIFLLVLQFSCVSIIPPMVHAHILINHQHCINLAIDSVVK